MIDNKNHEEKCNCPNCNPRLLFNEEDIYNHQIKPLLQKAKEIAIRNGIPILMATCYGAEKEGGTIKVHVDAGGAGREDWAPHSFVVARKMIVSEVKGEFPQGGGVIAIGSGPISIDGEVSGIIGQILGKIAEAIEANGDEKGDA